eukprot:TRINITY_DN6444_c0_g1_i2.p1 TRINITY_DN6444_c0_g1~~TRINITY_DN6444_c0_g1_i2.p1  ORF type:complete len:392 (+),score=157.75 TRINITY_DN6444_c0_g1_i2:68-1177(+)
MAAAGAGAAAFSVAHAQGAPIPSMYHPQGVDTSEADLLAARGQSGRRGQWPPVPKNGSGYITATTANGTTHRVYWEDAGNPDGQAVVIVHGGPGGACADSYRQFHDPKHYRIVLIDQRGCGRSTPHASLDENDTWALIRDMEAVRQELGIKSWQVFGGSWGATLSLSYAITHPDRVDSLILRGIFMVRRSELAWYYQEGASHIFPDRYEEYVKMIPPEERHDLITAYRKRLIGDDKQVQIEAARAWTQWENTTSNLFPKGSDEVKGDGDNFALAFARIENHFFHNHGFFEWDDWILDNVHRIRHIPTVIVQGRYDVVCPARSAWDLHKRFPEAEFHLLNDSGHSATEPGTLDLLVKAADKLKGVKPKAA